MKPAFAALLLPAFATAAYAQNAVPAPGAPAPKPVISAVAPILPAQGAGATLLLRGLDKITGRPTNITAPIGKPVKFATLTITARYCYSTPQSETPETAAFVQIKDQRPDQPERAVFSGWMYASSPGLNGMQHPLYDVWVITCNSSAPPPGVTTTAPVAVAAPDSSDKEPVGPVLPEDAGK